MSNPNPFWWPENRGNQYPLDSIFYQDPNKTNTYVLNLNLNKLQNSPSLWFLLWFLFLSVVCYVISSMMFKASMGEDYHVRMSQILDILVFTLVIIYVAVDYFNKENDEMYFSNILVDFSKFLNEPYSFFSLIVYGIVI